VAPLKAVAVSGSPRLPSKSKSLAELALGMLAERGWQTQLIDLSELPAEALLARGTAPALDAAIAAVGEARIVIAATPTYRALYTGLLKIFFDLMPSSHLAGKTCLPVQTGIAPQHTLAIEYGLRPLFASLDGLSLPGVYATDDEFVDGQASEKLSARLTQAVEAAVRLAGSA
jgi:FMN reductase